MGLDPETTADLVRATLEGDNHAFRRLVDRSRYVVFSLAYTRLQDRSEAEDVAQEAFIRAYRRLSALRRPERFEAWLCGIAANVAKEHARRRLFTVPLEFFRNIAARRPDHDKEYRVHVVMREVQRLPEQFSIPLVMRYVEELSYREIGGRLDIDEASARSRVYRARRQLAERLKRRFPTDFQG